MNVVLLKKNNGAFLNTFVPDEEKESDDKTLDLKLIKMVDGEAKGRDYMTLQIEADSRSSVYDLFYKYLSDKRTDLEHFNFEELHDLFSIKEFKVTGYHLNSSEVETFEYIDGHETIYTSKLANDVWAKKKIESDLSYMAIMDYFKKNKEANKHA